MTIDARSHGVLVWTTAPDRPEIIDRFDRYRSLLTDDEARRAARFVHFKDTALFVVGRRLGKDDALDVRRRPSARLVL